MLEYFQDSIQFERNDIYQTCILFKKKKFRARDLILYLFWFWNGVLLSKVLRRYCFFLIFHYNFYTCSPYYIKHTWSGKWGHISVGIFTKLSLIFHEAKLRRLMGRKIMWGQLPCQHWKCGYYLGTNPDLWGIMQLPQPQSRLLCICMYSDQKLLRNIFFNFYRQDVTTIKNLLSLRIWSSTLNQRNAERKCFLPVSVIQKKFTNSQM